MTDTLTLIARLTAKPDRAEMLGEALQSLVSPTRAEAGSIDYHLHRSSMRTGDRAPISMRISSSPTPKSSWRASRTCWPGTWN